MYASKADAIPELTGGKKSQTGIEGASAAPAATTGKEYVFSHAFTKVRSAQGLCELFGRRYRAAARYFLQCHFSEEPDAFLDSVSASNIAHYGALCALATYERAELQRMVLANAHFRQFLELEPALRDVLNNFYASRYGQCLRGLDELRPNLQLDIYLSAHVGPLYAAIRQRALCQFFSPFASVRLERMATAFHTSVEKIEDECMQLILDGQLAARIDSYKKVLHARSTDVRAAAVERVLAVGAEVERRTHALLLRAALLKNGITVSAPPGTGGATTAGVPRGPFDRPPRGDRHFAQQQFYPSFDEQGLNE